MHHLRMRVRRTAENVLSSPVGEALFYMACLGGLSVIRDHEAWPGAFLVAAAIAVPFTVLMWFVHRPAQRTENAIVSGLSDAQQRAVFAAAGTGTPPEPALRPAAVAVARGQLDESRRSRKLAIVVAPVLTAVSVVHAVTDNLLYLLAAAAFSAVFVQQLLYPRQLARHLAALEAAAAVSATAATPEPTRS
jgi:hypothetical protein